MTEKLHYIACGRIFGRPGLLLGLCPHVLMSSLILASFQGSILFAGKSLGMRILSHQQHLARCWVHHSTYVVTSGVLVTLYSQCNLIPSFFTVASCDNSGVNVRIIATGYIEAAVLQVDIVILEDGHFLKETARSQEWLVLQVTNAHQTTFHWLLFVKNHVSSKVVGSSTCNF